MNRILSPMAGGFLLLFSLGAGAAPVSVDLSTWTAETLSGGGVSGGGASWTVQNPPANDEVFQSVNGNSSVFFEPGADAQGMALSGTIRVTGGDDDFIGFVLGYDSGEMNSASTDFLLIDWKGSTQSLGGAAGTAFVGLAISRVTRANDVNGFWGHDSTEGVTEIARATNLGSTGWVGNTDYMFDLVFNSLLVEVFVDGTKELSITPADAGIASFDNGSFGFYNLSQGGVLYSALEEREAPPPPPPTTVPEPAPLALMGIGIIGLWAARSRNGKA